MVICSMVKSYFHAWVIRRMLSQRELGRNHMVTCSNAKSYSHRGVIECKLSRGDCFHNHSICSKVKSYFHGWVTSCRLSRRRFFHNRMVICSKVKSYLHGWVIGCRLSQGELFRNLRWSRICIVESSDAGLVTESFSKSSGHQFQGEIVFALLRHQTHDESRRVVS